MEKSRSFNSARNISFGTIKQVITLTLAFVTRTVFVRILGAEYTGISGLYSNILTVLSLAELGVGNVFVYSLYAPLREGNRNTICGLMFYFRRIYRVIAIAVACIGIALVPILKYIVNSELPQSELILYYLLYLSNSVASYLIIYKATLIQADQKVYIQNLIGTIILIIQYFLQVVYLLIEKNFVGYLVIQIICTCLQNVIINFTANRMYPYLKEEFMINKLNSGLNQMSENIKSMFLYKMSTVIINNTDNILISILLGTVFVGYYSNYYALTTYMSMFISLIATGIIASLGNLNAEKDMNKSYLLFRRMIYLFNIISCFCVSCYLAIVQDFIPFWIGSSYLLDNKIIIAIMISFYIANVTNPVWMYRETMGLFKEIKYIMVATALMNILLSIMLGKKYGMAGILIATGISRLLTIVWYEPKILFKKKFGVPVRDYLLQQLKYLIINLFVILSSVYICKQFGSGLIWMIFKILICTASTFVLQCLFMHTQDEFIWLKQKAKSLLCYKA